MKKLRIISRMKRRQRFTKKDLMAAMEYFERQDIRFNKAPYAWLHRPNFLCIDDLA